MKTQISWDMRLWWDWPPRWLRLVSGSAVGAAQAVDQAQSCRLSGVPRTIAPLSPPESIRTLPIAARLWYEVALRNPNGVIEFWRGVAYSARDAATQARIWSSVNGFDPERGARGCASTVTCVSPCRPEGK